MKATYLAVLVASAAVPLALGAHAHVRLYQQAKRLLPAILIPSLLFWLWDIAAAQRGHWSFNPDFVLGPALWGLPFEEFLFFPVVGFVSLFTYEALRHHLGKGPRP